MPSGLYAYYPCATFTTMQHSYCEITPPTATKLSYIALINMLKQITSTLCTQ